MTPAALDLVSTLFGRLSFGFSLWFAIPQIGEFYRLKPWDSGPSFLFLGLWLVGDVAQTIGLFVIGGLATQKASGICFALSTFVMLMQLCYYRGRTPWTTRHRDRIRQPVVAQLVSSTHRIMLVVWGVVDVGRHGATELEVALPPSSKAEKIGWCLGWAGTWLYTDVTFLAFYRLYRNNPHRQKIWSDPDWMYRSIDPARSAPPHAATGERAVVQKHEQDMHRALLPPISSPTQLEAVTSGELSSREARLRHEVSKNASLHLRRQIEQAEEELLRAETKWKDDSRYLPWTVKRRASVRLDAGHKSLARLWKLLEANGKEDTVEAREAETWRRETEGTRRRLEQARLERHRMVTKRESVGNSSDEASPGPMSSEDEGRRSLHQPQRRQSFTRMARQASVGRGKPHPRRGVGTWTDSEEWSESSDGSS
ncbi:hypothetical protein JCM3766R1_000930 [Sporobolomyces carnicolor]